MDDPRDGGWYWVLYQDWGGKTQWVPAQRVDNHWNSAIFRGMSLDEVTVGPELTPPASMAINQSPPPVTRPESELHRLLAEEERAHRERMAPYYKALARIEALRQPSPEILTAARIADGNIRTDMESWSPETGFRSNDPEGY